MRYNYLLCALTTLYGNLRNQSMFYVSYMTLYDFQEIFWTSKENERYTVFRLWIFLYDPCMISRKSYMILVRLLRNHTNHIWTCMNTRNHIWPSMTTKNCVWWATRERMLLSICCLEAQNNFITNFDEEAKGSKPKQIFVWKAKQV